MPDPIPPVIGPEEAWRRVADVDGWLTHEQAAALHAAARRVAPGPVLEIGSHQGRSTIVLACAGVEVVAIDPLRPDWRYGSTDTERVLRANLRRAGVAEVVDVRVATSREVRRGWVRPVRMLYVDGKHDVRSCLDDLRWSRFLQPGDPLLVHDAFSSVGVTLALLVDAATTGRHRYVGRTGSLAELVVARPTLRDRARVLGELPWFARNLVVKVLLRLRARPLVRALGHHDTADPY